MKTFTSIAAQGEITIRRIATRRTTWRCVPTGYSMMKPENGRYIIGHSETGHHHVMEARGATVAQLDKPPAGMRILMAILTEPLALEHLRPHDQHEPIALQPGAYEFRIGREYDPYAEVIRSQSD